MASPYQVTPSENKQPTDLEHINRGFDQQQQQMAVYAPLDERRLQTRMFPEQDKEDMRLGQNPRIGYLDEGQYEPPSSGARARRLFQGEDHGYGGDTGSKDYGSHAEYREPDYTRDSFARGGRNTYGKGLERARGIVNDNSASQGNAEYISGNRHRTSITGLIRGASPTNVGVYDEEDDDDEEFDDGDSLFVPEGIQPHNVHKSAKSAARQSGRTMQPADFNISPNLEPRLPPRSSGVHKRPNINLIPPTVPTSSISDAALLKRGLIRSKNAVMSKKSHGPNDPENILIVNLRENEKKTWPEIGQILNERRIKEGKSPSFTPNGCHNRYNRNAPILFAAEGKEFIPVNVQRKLEKNPKGPMSWDDEADTLLIKAVREVDSQKWERVAGLFNEYTGRHITATEAAMRTKVI